MTSTTDEVSVLTDNFLFSLADDVESEFLELLDGPSQSPIYGRDYESMQLLTAYNRVLQTHRPHIAVVHGVSGSGKTALVDALRAPVCDYGGYFCAGKFFQNDTQEPYSAIVAAFSDLCDLVLQSEDYNEARRCEIQQALGTDGRLLLCAITNISPFICELPDDKIDMEKETTFLKFKVACKSFLRAMSDERHPIVLFIDDLQWMDEGSRDLLGILLQDFDFGNVLLVFAYRDEDSEKVQGLLEKQALLADIQLAHLNASAVYQIVSSTVKTNSDTIRELSDLIAKRTAGNPFHVTQFLDVLQQEGLLSLSTTGSWIFEVDTIQREIMISDSLADLLYRRIQRLDPKLKETLKIASLLGYRFDKLILVEVACIAVHDNITRIISREMILSSLALSVKEEFIERTKAGFQFSHDKLKSAFQSMIGADEADQLHLLAGEAYLKRGDSFNAAMHLNAAVSFLNNHGQRVKLMRINSKAAKYCTDKLAFAMAASFLREGLQLLDEDAKWSEELYDLSFEMTESLARMELIIGNFDACKKATAETFCRAGSVEAQINSLLMGVEVRMLSNEVDESIVTANLALKILGVNMPRKVGFRHLFLKFKKVKRMLVRKSDDDVLGLPIMTNRVTSAAVKILMHVCLFCFYKDAKRQALYSALMGCQLTLTSGLSADSANAVCFYAISEVFHGNHDRAYRFGKLALQLQHRFDSEASPCPTIGLVLPIVLHWKEPLQNIVDPLYRAGLQGLDAGDVIYGTLCLSQSFFIDNMLGVNLQELEKRMRTEYGRICDLGQDGIIVYLQPILQHVLQLQSESTDWCQVCTLTGKIMDEEEFIQRCSYTKYRVLVGLVLREKAELACHFGLLELAESLVYRVTSLGVAMSSVSTGTYAWYFFSTFLFLERYRETGKRNHIRKARKYKKRLERMEAVGGPNARPLLAFLDAQEASLNGTTTSIHLSHAYDRAISLLVGSRMLQFEGMANEQAGFAFARFGHYTNSQRYFERALDIYKNEWGAIAKFNWLQEQSDAIWTVMRQGMEDSDSSRMCGNDILVGA